MHSVTTDENNNNNPTARIMDARANESADNWLGSTTTIRLPTAKIYSSDDDNEDGGMTIPKLKIVTEPAVSS